MTPMDKLLLELANERCGSEYTVLEVGGIIVESDKEQIREILIKRNGGPKAFKKTMSFKTYSKGTLCPSKKIMQDKRIDAIYKTATAMFN